MEVSNEVIDDFVKTEKELMQKQIIEYSIEFLCKLKPGDTFEVLYYTKPTNIYLVNEPSFFHGQVEVEGVIPDDPHVAQFLDEVYVICKPFSEQQCRLIHVDYETREISLCSVNSAGEVENIYTYATYVLPLGGLTPELSSAITDLETFFMAKTATRKKIYDGQLNNLVIGYFDSMEDKEERIGRLREHLEWKLDELIKDRDFHETVLVTFKSPLNQKIGVMARLQDFEEKKRQRNYTMVIDDIVYKCTITGFSLQKVLVDITKAGDESIKLQRNRFFFIPNQLREKCAEWVYEMNRISNTYRPMKKMETDESDYFYSDYFHYVKDNESAILSVENRLFSQMHSMWIFKAGLESFSKMFVEENPTKKRKI